MEKFKEIIFLNGLRRVGKKTIYSKYEQILKNADDFNNLVSEVKLNSKFTPEEIKKAVDHAEEAYEYIITSDISAITFLDDNYPKKLLDMEKDKPLILYVKGNVDALKEPNIAIIGTRKPLDDSEKFEEKIVNNIINGSNRIVVSGLALGCDKIAHQTTVEENKITIAILPSGVNVITPASNKKLAEEILLNNGCLVSEYEPNEKLSRGNYIDRDKIVAAFCDATFVVECGVKSGTMHTVNAANEYNRQIYAYLPTERPDGSYDGNEFILSENESAIKVEDIDEFLKDLNNLKVKKEVKSVQQTLM
ncbi:DNA-processing protein DprA [uncultured Methanobrevibacter sp.]|uniref:DNA-processing protein DprA n=1 Tax=uncultured Methanobrevibacter sp. TaxID=253161 RepID=UPI0025E3E26E|nr:DNA-processing protein DprA [uncultured Methanobrevibacter sp.]